MRLRLRRRLGFGAIGVPDRVRGGVGCEHERFGFAAFALRDVGHHPARGDRRVVGEDGFAVALDGVLVAMFDEQPVVMLVMLATAHAHERPTALQFVAMQGEFEVALFQRFLRCLSALDFPIAAVPHLHGPAAILVFGNCPFEIAVVERVIFGFDG